MQKVYINGLSSYGYENNFGHILSNQLVFNSGDLWLKLKNPDYKTYFSPTEIRRMSKIIKIGIVSAIEALKEAGNPDLDAIILGTGMGCMADSEKFLKTLIDNEEQYLTPTPFIQSTHNAVSGQIALHIKSKAYNFTYVQEAVSFESALLDSLTQIQLNMTQSILAGGIDEMTDYTLSIYQLNGFVKPKNDTAQTYHKSTSAGIIMGEGSNFFVLENTIKKTTYSELVDISINHYIDKSNIIHELESFLADNKLNISDIDGYLLGINNDRMFDDWYDSFLDNMEINSKPIIYYKPVCGEFHTASSFGFWLANQIIKTQEIPKKLIINNQDAKEIKHIVLYNQYRGNNHSFTLLKKV